jgi:cyanophycinase
MAGTLVLVGSGEFTSAMERVDRDLLAATGRSRPRVVIIPTASAPDGEAVFQRWVEEGCRHFGALGAEVEPILVHDRREADDPAWAQALGEADLVYLSGGKPGALHAVLDGSPLGAALIDAHRRGAVVAGSSAGAIVLGSCRLTVRRHVRPIAWQGALGLAPGVAIVPHYDAMPEALLAFVVLQAPRGTTVVGIDEETAMVGRDGSWQVAGPGRITLWRGRHRTRFHEGDVIRL